MLSPYSFRYIFRTKSAALSTKSALLTTESHAPVLLRWILLVHFHTQHQSQEVLDTDTYSVSYRHRVKLLTAGLK